MVTEGNYTGYTKVRDSNDIEAVQGGFQDFDQNSAFNTNETKALFASSTYLMIFTVSDSSFSISASGLVRDSHYPQVFDSSAYGKYFAVINQNEDTLRVYKDGVLIETLTSDGAGEYIECVLVSPTGRYIAVFYDNAGATESYIRLYEGS